MVLSRQGSFSSEESSSTAFLEEGSQGKARKREELAAEESRTVQKSKRLVYLAIVITGIIVANVVLIITRRSEESKFRNEFTAFANEIIDNSEGNAEAQVSTARAIATTCTSFASATNAVWPNVTIPDFVRRVKQDDLSGFDRSLVLLPILPRNQKESYEAYARDNLGWIAQGYRFEGISAPIYSESNFTVEDFLTDAEVSAETAANTNRVQGLDAENTTASGRDIYVPMWQTAPTAISVVSLINFDSLLWFRDLADIVQETKAPILSGFNDFFGSIPGESQVNRTRSIILAPVFEEFSENEEGDNEQVNNSRNSSSIVGYIMALLPWESFFENVLTPGLPPILVEVNDNCGQVFTYEVQGKVATVVGAGALHDNGYNNVRVTSSFARFINSANVSAVSGFSSCLFTIDIYPTAALERKYRGNEPYFFALGIFAIFFTVTAIFGFYDYTVQKRQDVVVSVAERTNDIVASLFPKNVQERIMQEAQEKAEAEAALANKRYNFRSSSAANDELAPHKKGKPIADLFPATTIMFGDLVGFTAWSSVQQPSQVFTLLETIYYEFDQIAKRRRVFKVETVGDCYVAVTGLPDPRPDHAVAMARFARDCREKMILLIQELEEHMGPETGELGLRVGLHSGPVTAGVLRGEKARFQLFGDTMNTTSRIETTGKKNMIHLSEETANLLKEAGKEHWVELREDRVVAKGKGELTTYWLRQDKTKGVSSSTSSSQTSSLTNVSSEATDTKVLPVEVNGTDAKSLRLVKWNTEVLTRLLKLVVTARQNSNMVRNSSSDLSKLEEKSKASSVIDEVVDVISLHKYDVKKDVVADIKLPEPAQKQLEQYVQAVANLYLANSFHNFAHASHVLMSVTKLMARIVEAPQFGNKAGAEEGAQGDHSYGIATDPLLHFGVAFSALIHDVDHHGVPNAQLIKEQSPIAACYNNKSIAEQNSVDIAWNLLMDGSFVDLRRAIYTTEAEFDHFREVVANAVMATDIMDRELAASRRARWERAFCESPSMSTVDSNRRATIVIEYVMQASDVSHTMQHWHIYRKWNSRLFSETKTAFLRGRSNIDPAENWYKGEIGFFDHYVIPMAKKLKDCGVFGVSSDEYLIYAQNNRDEWEKKGKSIVAEMTGNHI